ncbi:MAG: DUF6036 family nucleotidyltransferase [Candidatus Helarchaeota archaeon]
MENLKREFQLIIQKWRNIEEIYMKKLLFLGFINKYLTEIGSRIIVLGGFAVQFYLAGEYLTQDIDLACDNRDYLKKLLETLKFKRVGRHYFSEQLNLAIEMPVASLSHQKQEKLVVIEINGYEVPILGLEDIIIDRINSFVFWQSLEDGRLARELIYIHYEEIDWNYLFNRAEEEHVKENLEEMVEKIKVEFDKK